MPQYIVFMHFEKQKTLRMTAQLAGMRSGLISLGFSSAVAANKIIMNQGYYDDLTSLAELTDSMINNLIDTI
jgi:hypothetical protein